MSTLWGWDRHWRTLAGADLDLSAPEALRDSSRPEAELRHNCGERGCAWCLEVCAGFHSGDTAPALDHQTEVIPRPMQMIQGSGQGAVGSEMESPLGYSGSLGTITCLCLVVVEVSPEGITFQDIFFLFQIECQL